MAEAGVLDPATGQQQGGVSIDWGTYQPVAKPAATAPKASASPEIDWSTYTPITGQSGAPKQAPPPPAPAGYPSQADSEALPGAPPVAGAGTLGLPQPAAPAAGYMKPSLLGEIAGATKEAATHPIETLTGADLPSQVAEKQTALEQGAAGGSNIAQKALDVQKAAQTPLWQPSQSKTFQQTLDPKSKNVFSRVLTGGTKALESLATPENLELMGTIPFAPEDAQQILSGVFAGQMAQGAGQEGFEALRAAHRGDYGEAAERGATALINAAMAAASAKHAAGKEVTAPTSDNVSRGTSAETEPKPVLHDSNNVEELRASAERQAPAIGAKVAAATEGVPGAKLEAVRDSKDTDRIEDKATRQAVEPNQIADIAAAKVTVPDQAAADKVLENLHEQMPVESVNGSLEEPGKNGVRQVQAVVNTGAEGEPVQRAEVLIQTPEMNEATARTHDDYRKSQELRAAGKIEEANALEDKITAEHEAAAKLSESNQGERGKVVSSKSPEPAAGGDRGVAPAAETAEPKYKFGSTQTNIPKDSEAAQALATARGKIDKADLMSTDHGGDGQGLEEEPHVTVRYGIKGEDTAKLRKFIESQEPFDAKLGKTSSFPATEHSDGAAPIIAPVEAPELHRIEAEMDKHGDFADRSFPEYKPHATLGYVKPEAAEKYTGDTTTEGKRFRVNSIAITDRNGNATEIPLRGRAAREEAGIKLPQAPKPPVSLVKDAGGKEHAVPDWAAKQLKAPKPPQPKEGFTPGRQSTPAEVRVDGKWEPATLDYYGHGADWQLRRSRATLADGSKVNNIKDADIRAAKDTAKPRADIGIDFDGTLAKDTGGNKLGAALPERIASVKKMLAEGKSVEIITRRVEDDASGAEAKKIQDWLEKNGLPRLPVTNEKTAGLLYDDNAHHAPSNENTPLVPHERVADVEPGGQRGEQGDTGVAAKRAELGKGDVSQAATTDTGGRNRVSAKSDGVLRDANGSSTGEPGGDSGRTANDVSAPASQTGGDAERPKADDAVRREQVGQDVPEHPEIARERKDNDARLADRRKNFEAANKRSLAENAAAHKSEVVEVAGRKALSLDPDGEGVWHRVFSKLKNNAAGQNPLGANTGWRGMTLSKQQVQTAIAFLRGSAEDMRVAGVPDSGGFERLADSLKESRDHTGGAIVLRGDYRADTAREEATHQWQLEHGLYQSDAMRGVADRPEFEAAMERLHEMGYRDAQPSILAMEMMAKAMAGDTDFPVTDEQRESLVRSFLTEAVEDKGQEILKNLPETDPRLKAVIGEVRRGYDYGDEYSQRDERGGQQEIRGSVRQAGGEVREGDRASARERRGSERADEGAGRGVPKERTAEGELKAPKPPDKQTAKAEPTTGSDEPVFQRDKEVEASPAFRKWFGGSKVVEKDGTPAVVYHGTSADFDSFDPGRTGERDMSDTGDFGKGIYFADKPETANNYVFDLKKSDKEAYNGAKVMPAYLRAENPLVLHNPFTKLYDLAGGEEKWVDLSPDEKAKTIRDAGYDSVHDVSYGQWAVFEPDQIKSALGNKGTFDRENPSILFQKTKEGENPVAKSVSELVDDLKALPKADKGTALDRVVQWSKDAAEESVDRSAKSLGGIPSKFEKAFAWAKGITAALVHDYKNPLEQTDWKNVMGQHQLAQAETALKLQDMAKELKVQAPKELDRIAMTHYMEANGSDAKLKEWQAGNRARAMEAIGSDRARYLREAQKHYDKALELTPEQKTLAKRLRQHFNDTLDIAKENGLLEYGYRNYVMHIYEKEEAANLLHLIDTQDLNPNPSFIKRRFHETLYDAEAAGLTPKSKDIGFLSTAYDKSLNEGIASRTAIKNLLDAKAADGRPIAAIKTTGGWVIEKGDDARQVLNQRPRPQNMTVEGYKSVDRPQLRNFLFKPTTADLQGIDPQFLDEDLAFRGDLMIHPKFVSRVEDMLTPSWFERGESVPQKIGHAVLQGSAAAKELMTIVAPFHLATEGRHALSHKINPFKVHAIDLNDPTERLLASHGLTLTNYDAEGLFSTKALQGLGEIFPGVNKALDTVHKFSQWQFQEYIPGLKMAMAKEAFDRNTKRYSNLTKEQVAELSARESNAAFGNLNSTFDRIPRTKTFKSLMRLAMFAPDFLESRVRFMGQAFTRYGGEQRAALIRSALVTYATMRVANALLNNGDAKWDPEHAFTMVVHGKNYNVRSVEQDALHAITDPRSFIYNRLNPLTTRPLTEFLSGRDQYGRQKTVTSQAKDVAKSTLPFGVQKVIQTPDESLMDSLLTSIGLGTSNYRSPTEEAVHKLYIANIPPGADDEAKEAESRKLRGYEDKVRSGHMAPAEVWAKVEKKEITAQEAGRTVRRAQKSRMEYEFSHLHLKDAIDVYAKATPLEQAELRPEFARKQAGIAALPEAQREKTAERMQELLAENQQK